ncbi:hypothetical protein Lmor_3161 [Legionella moravica]|uniref:Uncharacterized protein n=1 Tax=Legionella moravica TaxID=39962 RepID=A0A378JYK2_9GAMM|nr:hypothetical protein Lmor_3161 [Legionella moravica]STX63634.1 Uncharacterised protein [Legionella moravica]
MNIMGFECRRVWYDLQFDSYEGRRVQIVQYFNTHSTKKYVGMSTKEIKSLFISNRTDARCVFGRG